MAPDGPGPATTGPSPAIVLVSAEHADRLLAEFCRYERDYALLTAHSRSDWGSSVPDPEALTAKIIAPPGSLLGLEIRDFFDRMGMPVRRYDPDSGSAAACQISFRPAPDSRWSGR